MSSARVTLADVARRAGASHSAASRTLNDRAGVRPEVRAAVLRAAEELGYRPNRAARNLVMGKTSSIGLVIADRDVVVGTMVFSELVSSIVTSMAAADYQTVLMLPADVRDPNGIIDSITRMQVDGVVVVGHRSGDRLLAWLASDGPPTVVLGRPDKGPSLSYIDVDNVDAARGVVEHLLATGRRRVGLLAGPQTVTWGQDRLLGYTQVLREHGSFDESLVVECAMSFEAGSAGMATLLERHPDLDAVVLCSESILHGCISQLRHAGVAVPEQLALVTFDDGPTQEHSVPSITAVRQPLTLMGRELARTLIDEIEIASPARRIRMEAELIVRASSAERPA